MRPNWHSIALRLTLFHALFFGVVTSAGGVILYHLIGVYIVDEIDQDVLRQEKEIVRALQTEASARVQAEVAADTRNGSKEDYFVRVTDRAGHLLLGSDLSGWPDSRSLDALARDLAPGQRQLATLALADARGQARVLTAVMPPDRVLQIGISMGDSVAFLAHFRHYGLIILASMLSLGTIAGWGLSRKAMAGVLAKRTVMIARDRAGGNS